MKHIYPLQPSRPLWRRAGFFAFLLLITALGLVMSIVYLQHQIRLLETRYAEKLHEAKHLDEEWGRLSLEKNHLSAPARVEQIAVHQLGMRLDDRKKDVRQVIFIQPVKSDPREPMNAEEAHDAVPTNPMAKTVQ